LTLLLFREASMCCSGRRIFRTDLVNRSSQQSICRFRTTLHAPRQPNPTWELCLSSI
jgi:hypothetical protein